MQRNVPKMHSYISKGEYTRAAGCQGKTYERNGQEFISHFERTYITLDVIEHELRTETGVLSKKGFDILLPFNIRMPIEKKFYRDNRLGTMVWDGGASTCKPNVGFTNQFVELYQGDVDLYLKKQNPENSKYDNALITVYDDKDELTELPVTFGYSVRFKITVCGKSAYQTNGQTGTAKHMIYSPYKIKRYFPHSTRILTSKYDFRSNL